MSSVITERVWSLKTWETLTCTKTSIQMKKYSS